MAEDKKPIRFTYTSKGIAGMFLLKYAPNCGGDAQEHLGQIFDDCFNQGLILSLEKAKDEYRKIHPGGCRILSNGLNGEECECFLCVCDRLKAAVLLQGEPGEDPRLKAALHPQGEPGEDPGEDVPQDVLDEDSDEEVRRIQADDEGV